MKLTVINKIAKSKCCLIDDGLKVYDSNGLWRILNVQMLVEQSLKIMLYAEQTG